MVLFTKDIHVAAAKSLQSCPTLCDLIDGSPLGSPIPGILRARILEWVAISFSKRYTWHFLNTTAALIIHLELQTNWSAPSSGCATDKSNWNFSQSMITIFVPLNLSSLLPSKLVTYGDAQVNILGDSLDPFSLSLSLTGIWILQMAHLPYLINVIRIPTITSTLIEFYNLLMRIS